MSISNLVAAELSQAAYASFASFSSGNTQYTLDGVLYSLPSGWVANLSAPYSQVSTDGTNQFITFVNNTTDQVVMAFKGTNTVSQLKSDLTDGGDAAWNKIAAAANSALNGAGGVLDTYAGYTVMTDGHSLGGGMAQTFALINNLSGYGQNSLPVIKAAVPLVGSETLASFIGAWQTAGGTFTEVNTQADIATAFYRNGTYLDTSPTTLGDPYAAEVLEGYNLEQDGLKIGDAAMTLAGKEEMLWYAGQAHKISSVIAALGTSTSPITLPGNINIALSGALNDETTVENTDGSIAMTDIGGSTYTDIGVASATPISSLSSLATGEIYIFDPTTDNAFVMTESGQTPEAIAYDESTGGSLVFNQASHGSGTLTLSDGAVLSVGGTADLNLVNIAGGSDADEQTLLDYLNAIGYTTTASALNTANFDYLNPTGSSYTVTGTVSGSNDTFTLTSSSAAGAQVTGVSGKTNTLNAYGDLTQDTIGSIQYLDIDGSGNIALTGSEFGLSGMTIEGGGTITIDTAGSYSSTGLSGNFNLKAGDWGGTTFTGDNHNGQTLTASLFGDDELDAGSGTGDTLIAGEGVDTLNGGSGGDTFKALNGLAASSAITGSGSGNKLIADGDISGATISGVQELDIGGTGGNSIALTAAQLAAFSSLNLGFVDTINASGGGTYSVAGATDSGNLTINTDAADNTTLTGDSVGYETLSAADSGGDDTLTAGTGNNDNLIADGSSGDDTLTATAGGGSQDNLSAQYSTGNDTLTAGNGSEVTLTVQYSTGNDTLTAGNGSDDTLSAQYSTGTDTLTVGSGTDDLLIAGDGVDTLTGSSAGYTLFRALDGLAAGSSVTGYGTGNSLTADGDISGATIGGVQTLDVYNSGSNSVMLTHSQFTGFSAISGYSDTIIAATGGTYTLSSGDTVGTLITDAADNTTLNGNDTSGETLSAAGSTGTDTLTAGNGGGDILIAGEGVDTLTGGTGGDTFNLGAGVASGTTVTGNGYGNAILTNASDISGVTISGVTTLDDNSASLTLTSSQLSAFSTFVNASGSSETLAFTSNGTYSLSGKSVSGSFALDASATTGTVSLNTGSGNNTLIAGSGTDTLTGGAGFDVFVTGTGADTIYGGSYNNWVGVYGITLSSSTALIGGAGGNTLQIGGAYGDISQAYITGFAALDIDATVTLTASQLAGFGYIGSDYSTGGTIQAADADTYHLDYADIEQPVTFIAAVGGGTTVYAGGNAETFVTSAAGGDVIWGGTGNTVDVSANGIGGADNYIIMADGTVNFADNARADTYVTGSANTINAGADDTVGSDGGNVIYATGSGDAIWLFGYGGDVAYISASGGNEVVYASSTGDTLHVSGNGAGGTDNYLNIVSGTVDYAANARGDVYGTGNTINAGNTDTVGIDGSSNTVNAGNGDAIWVSGGGTGVQINGGGSDSYYFASGFGTDTINNAATGGATSANGYVNFLSSISDENLWFKQSGNDLVVDVLDTTNQITISNWYTSAGDQVSGFAANGLELDSQLASLVSAMATYQSAHSGFNPTTATSMPTDTTLQSAIAASWHS